MFPPNHAIHQRRLIIGKTSVKTFDKQIERFLKQMLFYIIQYDHK